MNELTTTLLLGGGFLSVFAAGEALFHLGKVQVEITRKFVHLSSGLLTLTFPLWLKNHWYVLALCSSFAVLLLISKKNNFLQSVNKVDRKTRGSYLFPAAIYFSYLFFIKHQDLLYFFLPVLILAISDPLAALTGKNWPAGKYRSGNNYKTITGSSAFLLSALVICIFLLLLLSGFDMGVILLYAGIIAVTATFSEAVSQNGWDNLTIPVSVILSYFLLNDL